MRTNFMTGKQVVEEMRSESLLKAVHTVIATATAEIATGMEQRTPLCIVEIRNIEFDAAIKIAAILGVRLEPGQGVKDGATPNP